MHKRNLDDHINSQHTKENKYKCDFCDFSTFHKETIGRHMNSQHTKEKEYKCTRCDFSTLDHSSFCKHKNKHFENNINSINNGFYWCQNCELEFESNDQYLDHQIQIHC